MKKNFFKLIQELNSKNKAKGQSNNRYSNNSNTNTNNKEENNNPNKNNSNSNNTENNNTTNNMNKIIKSYMEKTKFVIQLILHELYKIYEILNKSSKVIQLIFSLPLNAIDVSISINTIYFFI